MQQVRSLAFLSLILTTTVSALSCLSCKPREFNDKSNQASERQSQGEPTSFTFFDDPTNTYFKAEKQKLTFAKANIANKNWLNDTLKSENNPERLSAMHQDDLLRVLSTPYLDKLEALGLKRETFLCGVIDTDKGKLQIYKNLLTEPSDKSDFLLSTMKGKPTADGRNLKALAVIGQYLSTLSLKGWALNPALSNDELRAIFKRVPLLAGWMHDWPGLSDSMELLAQNIITPDEFFEIVSIALFHNGPQEGFWKFLTETAVPNALNNPEVNNPDAPPLAKDLFVNTFYLTKAASAGSSAYSYPTPQTFSGILHVIFDRLSQGTKGGVHKIWYEMSASTPTLKIFKSLVGDNQTGTIKQLNALKSHVLALKKQNAIPQKIQPLTTLQADELVKIIDRAILRIDLLANNLNGKNKAQAKITLTETAVTIKHFDRKREDFKVTSDTNQKEALENLLLWLDDEEKASTEAFNAVLKL